MDIRPGKECPPTVCRRWSGEPVHGTMIVASNIGNVLMKFAIGPKMGANGENRPGIVLMTTHF